MRTLIFFGLLLLSDEIAVLYGGSEHDYVAGHSARESVLATERETVSALTDYSERECVGRAPVVTSEIRVQIYLLPPVSGGLLAAVDEEVIVTSRDGKVRSAKTDAHGFVRFQGLPNRDYELSVRADRMEPYIQEVRVRSGRSRTIAVIANFTCGLACVVDAPRVPLVAPPRCLFSREP